MNKVVHRAPRQPLLPVLLCRSRVKFLVVGISPKVGIPACKCDCFQGKLIVVDLVSFVELNICEDRRRRRFRLVVVALFLFRRFFLGLRTS